MNSRVTWETPPSTHPSISNDEVHVWLARLSVWKTKAPAFLEILTPDERTRAERFHFKTHQLHFILTRGILRTLLARYLHGRPEQVHLTYNAYGKPALAHNDADANGSHALRFNLSHADELALFAFTVEREIGVDIERIRDDFACDEIAARFFSAREVAMLHLLPERQRREGFFNCWTRKEAYVKARGAGLSLPLDGFDVSLAPDEPASLLSVTGAPEESRNWRLQELTTEAGYTAALAVEGRDWQLRCRQWSG